MGRSQTESSCKLSCNSSVTEC